MFNLKFNDLRLVEDRYQPTSRFIRLDVSWWQFVDVTHLGWLEDRPRGGKKTNLPGVRRFRTDSTIIYSWLATPEIQKRWTTTLWARVERLITFNLLAYLWGWSEYRSSETRPRRPEPLANAHATDNCPEHGPRRGGNREELWRKLDDGWPAGSNNESVHSCSVISQTIE